MQIHPLIPCTEQLLFFPPVDGNSKPSIVEASSLENRQDPYSFRNHLTVISIVVLNHGKLHASRLAPSFEWRIFFLFLRFFFSRGIERFHLKLRHFSLDAAQRG
jgi:hypothetical protein